MKGKKKNKALLFMGEGSLKRKGYCQWLGALLDAGLSRDFPLF
jgi:hypothetical protein